MGSELTREMVLSLVCVVKNPMHNNCETWIVYKALPSQLSQSGLWKLDMTSGFGFHCRALWWLFICDVGSYLTTFGYPYVGISFHITIPIYLSN